MDKKRCNSSNWRCFRPGIIVHFSLCSDESLRSEESASEEPITVDPSPVLVEMTSPAPSWTDIDQADAHDPSYSTEYAPEIYQYMREREVSVEHGNAGLIDIHIYSTYINFVHEISHVL